MEYRCRLGTPGGEIIEGVYVADSEARLRREFEEKGLLVLAIQQAGRRALAGVHLPAMPHRKKVPSREFLVYNQELATLLKAGMPLVQSLDILRQRVTNPTFKPVLDDVYERVRSGSALSEAFEAHAGLFPGVYTASLLAGEKSGNLEQVLRRYVSYVKVVSGVRRKTISALVYPAILVLLSIIVVTVIVVKVVPEFGNFYNQFGKELPLSTRFIVGLSTFVTTYFLLIFGGIAALVAAVLWWVRQPGQRRRLHRLILKLPMLGSIAQKFSTSQGARTLATLLGGGIPLVNALEVTARSMGNLHMAAELTNAAQQVREGRSLAAHAAGQRRVSRRRDQDGGGRRVHRRAPGNAEQPRRFLRRGDRHEPRAVRHGDRAGAAGDHGRRDRRAAALAVSAALQPVVGAQQLGEPTQVSSN